jgi:hypothetical protein
MQVAIGCIAFTFGAEAVISLLYAFPPKNATVKIREAPEIAGLAE